MINTIHIEAVWRSKEFFKYIRHIWVTFGLTVMTVSFVKGKLFFV